MINLSSFSDLTHIQLTDFNPKPTSLTAGQLESLKELWMSDDQKTKVGLWECTEGVFTADRSQMAEYCHIISGEAIVENEDGSNPRKIKSGDLLVLPIGWKGKWTITQQMKKLYVLNYP